MTSRADIAEAVAHHRAGRLGEAERIYRAILAVEPDHADSLHLMGLLALGVGRTDEAADLVERAILSGPRVAVFHNSLGDVRAAQGRWREAAQAHQRALALKPDDAGALNSLGRALAQQGALDQAIAHYQTALAIRPDFLMAMVNLGSALQALGRLDEARSRFDAALAVDPNLAEALNNAGIVFARSGRASEAMACYRQALAIKPDLAEAHLNIGVALRKQGDLDGAVACCRQALALRSDFGEAHINLGQALADQGHASEAIAHYRRGLEIRPDLAEGHYCLGLALHGLDALDQAVAAYKAALAVEPDHRKARTALGLVSLARGRLEDARLQLESALRIDPDDTAALNGLGVVMTRMGLAREAEAPLRRALEIKPDLAVALHSLGKTLKALGRIDEAIESYQRALAIEEDAIPGASDVAAIGRFDDPQALDHATLRAVRDVAATHTDLGEALLIRGDFARGWPHYEWRRYLKEIWRPPRLSPMWDGGDLRGRTIILNSEQGLGDNIQFVRFAPMVAARGARVLVRTHDTLARLFAGVSGVDLVVKGEDEAPAHDLHASMLSLPGLLGVSLQTLPAEIPYLRAEPPRRSVWRERLADRGGLKVGVAWRGNPLNGNDPIRSMTAAAMARCLDAGGVAIVSLQKDASAAEIQALGADVFDAGAHLSDMSDTAALIAELDLVISVDSAMCHLAGALGAPVWTLINAAPDWRWMLNRADSPWYPTMRLFRQPRPGDWAGVADQVREALASLRCG